MRSTSGNGCIHAGLGQGLCGRRGHSSGHSLGEELVVQLGVGHLLGASCSRGEGAHLSIHIRKSVNAGHTWGPI